LDEEDGGAESGVDSIDEGGFVGNAILMNDVRPSVVVDSIAIELGNLDGQSDSGVVVKIGKSDVVVLPLGVAGNDVIREFEGLVEVVGGLVLLVLEGVDDVVGVGDESPVRDVDVCVKLEVGDVSLVKEEDVWLEFVAEELVVFTYLERVEVRVASDNLPVIMGVVERLVLLNLEKLVEEVEKTREMVLVMKDVEVLIKREIDETLRL
jgi:hypothetical protein